ncbi:MAG: hypothetical protein ACR2RB_07850 [Gammaproteobacteria bacterium]
MRNHMRITVLTTIILLVSAGCAGLGQSKKEQFAGEGCLGGGAGGGLLGAVVSKDKDKAKNAAIGAAASCAAAAVVGYQVGARTEEYANSQEAVSAEVARSERNLTEVRQYNTQVAQNIQDYEQHILEIRNSELSAAEKNEGLTEAREVVTDQRQQAAAAHKSVNEELKIAAEQYNTYRTSTAPEEADAWRQKLVALQEERNILGSHVNSLNALSASI